MTADLIDDVDRGILHVLQVDARNNTNTEIGDRVDVAASTVSNRIRRMEEEGIINGYYPDIDYDKAGLPLYNLFVCTAPVPRRRELAEGALDLYGVVDVRETVSGERNVHVETVSQSGRDLEEVTQALDDIGLKIRSSEIVQRHRTRPFDHFGSDVFDD